ncbi:MAG: hypothetical protein K0M45_02715 [Candidatus Paracaedibacteraceae bacterium]|nr:hypothetical protein [Candidatus Paracaedibacteraceae bacterium]
MLQAVNQGDSIRQKSIGAWQTGSNPLRVSIKFLSWSARWEEATGLAKEVSAVISEALLLQLFNKTRLKDSIIDLFNILFP